jgi:GxxExxY protein
VIGGYHSVYRELNQAVIVEVKSREIITISDERQVTNYLKATDLEVGLIFNFGPASKFQRIVYSNSRK